MNRDNMDNNMTNATLRKYQSPMGSEMEILNSLTNGLLSVHEEVGYLKEHFLNLHDNQSGFINKEVKVGSVSLSPEDGKRLKEMSDNIIRLYGEVKELKKENETFLTETVEQLGRQSHEQFVDMTKEVFTMEKIVENMKGQIAKDIFNSISQKFDNEFFGSDSMVTKVVSNIVESVERKIEMKFADVFVTLNNMQHQMNDNMLNITAKIEDTFQKNVEQANYNFNEVQCNLNDQFAEVKSYINSSYSQIKNKIDLDSESNNDFMSKMQIEMRAQNNKIDILVRSSLATKPLNTELLENTLEALNDKIVQLNTNGVPRTSQDGSPCDAPISPYTNSDLERKLESIFDDITNKFDYKFALIHGEIITLQDNVEKEIPRLIKETVASTLIYQDDEKIKGLLEKISNQVGLDNMEKSTKINEITSEIHNLKNQMKDDSLGNIDEDMSQSFSSLRGELDNLSKLIVDSKDELNSNTSDSVPSSISNISEELKNLSKNMFEL